mgnify:FL=1
MMLQNEIDFMEADLMSLDHTSNYIPYEIHFREYEIHEMMNDRMEYVRRPGKPLNDPNTCLLCHVLKRPTELVDGRTSNSESLICLRCAMPPCEKCGDKAWAWELLEEGCRTPYRPGECCNFDLQGHDKPCPDRPEEYPLSDEITASLLRQLCLQGVSWERFRKK